MKKQTQRDVAYGEGRDAILRATVTIVAQKGLRGLTHRAVASEAGVALGLVSHHFGTRDALVEAAADYVLQPLLELSRFTGNTEDLPSMFDSVVDSLETEPDYVVFTYEVVVESYRRPEIRPAIQRLISTMREAMLNELRAHGLSASQEISDVAASALEGILLHALATGDLDYARSQFKELAWILAAVS